MNEEIMVSINCITYNQEAYISDAIESFLMQKTNFKYEILIHDDASTDNTTSIIKKYEMKYPDIIKPIYQKENKYSKGIEVNYEYNFKRSKGKYIALCEGDDYWTDPYKLQKQVDYMEANPECTLCMHSVELVNATTNKVIGLINPYSYSTKSSIEDVIMGGGEFIGTNSILFPKNVFENPPKWYFNCPVGDYPLQILLAYKGYAYYIDESMSVYRTMSENSWSKRIINGGVKKYIELNDKLNLMLDEFNFYSNNKYNEYINTRQKMNSFNKLMAINDLKGLQSPEFKNFYTELDRKSKIKLFIKYYIPISSKLIGYLRSKL